MLLLIFINHYDEFFLVNFIKLPLNFIIHCINKKCTIESTSNSFINVKHEVQLHDLYGLKTKQKIQSTRSSKK